VAGGAALLCLLVAYSYEGVYIELEPPMVFLALAALPLCFFAGESKGMLVLSGAAAACAFLTKQYGLAALPPLLLFVLLRGSTWRMRVAGAAAIGVGFAAAFVVFFGFHAAVLGVMPGAMTEVWFGKGYPSWGLERALRFAARYIWPQQTYVILFPLLLLDRRLRRDPRVAAVLLAFVLFAAPLYVRTYGHYFLSVIPFLVLLGAFVVGRGLQWARFAPIVVVVALSSVFFTSQQAYRTYRHFEVHWDRAAQVNAAAAVNEVVPRGSPALVLPSPHQWLTYLCDFASPAPKLLGYSFPKGLTPRMRREVLSTGCPAIVTPESVEGDPAWLEVLLAEGYRKSQTVPPDLEIWRPGP
jgi:hypothetical protein